jgi:uncharacterized SAM-binding protein YcdF (DUF218 family)
MTGPGRIPAPLRTVLLAICLMAAGWAAGFVAFGVSMARAVEDADTRTDAIVVLTGGSERLAKGLALLDQGMGKMLFISGVHKGVDLAELLHRAGRDQATSANIVLGHAADDTIGNAAETAQWMEASHFTSLRLVTASYHLRRASLEFRRAMPGVTIVANPVFPDAFKIKEWWRWPGTAHLLATEYTKYLGALARPLFAAKPQEKKS